MRKGTPAVHRKATRAIPLSTISSPTIWKIGRRRVTRTKKPSSKVATPTGTSAPAVVPDEAATPRAAAKARTMSTAEATSEAGTLTRGLRLPVERPRQPARGQAGPG